MRRLHPITLLILFGVMTGMSFGCRSAPSAEEVETAFEAASQLGLSSDALLLQEYQCVDMGRRCGIYLHFTEMKNLEAFAPQIEQLDMTLDASREVDGFTVFTDLNLGRDPLLTAGGNDGLGSRESIRHPLARRWILTDRQGQEWFITFYQIADVEQAYRLNGQPFADNIVTVIYQVSN